MNITVNSISLHYETAGSGDPMMLLHGNGQDHHIFDKLAGKLAAHFTVYSIDSRNHGQSEKTEEYSYQTMAADMHAFIKALELPPVYITGFSDGAVISLLLAMRHGECIRKMALLGVNLKPDDLTERSMQFIKDTYARTRDPLFHLMLTQPHIELDEVRAVRIPTLVVAAEREIFRPETFPALVQAMPDASLKIMQGHKHETYVVGQDILYPDLMRFFDKKGVR